jgi:hypothetical protein
VTITAAEALPGDILLDSTGTAWQRGLDFFLWSTFTGPIMYFGQWEPEYGPQGELVLLVRDGQPVTG